MDYPVGNSHSFVNEQRMVKPHAIFALGLTMRIGHTAVTDAVDGLFKVGC